MTTRVFVVVGRTGVADERGSDARFATGLGQCRGCLVPSGDSDERGMTAERDDIARDVGRAAHAIHVVVERDDRDGCFRRNACHAADDELVDHRVADDEDVDPAHARDDLARALRREWRQQHRRDEMRRTEE